MLAADESVEYKGLRISKALTDAEIDLIRMVADGKTNREIASAFNLAENTIKTHLTRIVAKLELPYGDRALIVSTAFRRNIIT